MRRWALVPVVLACAAIAAPWLSSHSPVVAFALQRAFSLVCHQQPERSFVLFGGSVAVCSRCLGIYLGAAIGLRLGASRQVAFRVFLAAVAINGIDGLIELAGLHGNWMSLRFGLGFALGLAGAMLVMTSIDEVKIPTQAKAA